MILPLVEKFSNVTLASHVNFVYPVPRTSICSAVRYNGNVSLRNDLRAATLRNSIISLHDDGVFICKTQVLMSLLV